MWPDGEIIFQYVVIYYNENMPKCENFPKVGLENFAKYQIAPRKITKDFKNLPKWQNFGKSGHTGCGSVVRAVAFDTDSRQGQILFKDENREKEKAPILSWLWSLYVDIFSTNNKTKICWLWLVKSWRWLDLNPLMYLSRLYETASLTVPP